jgi:aminoglycoside 6'-N-acetyltransferase
MPGHPAITFRPIAPTDLPLMHRWRSNPVVARWWHPMPCYDDIVAKYLPRISGRTPVYPFVASAAGQPFGYLQWYRLAQNPGHPAEAWAGPGAAAVDLFIGEDDFRGRGLGAAMLRAFVRSIVFAEHDVASCFIDPHPDNAAAIRSYQCAGFRALEIAARGDGGDPAWLMRIDREEVSEV